MQDIIFNDDYMRGEFNYTFSNELQNISEINKNDYKSMTIENMIALLLKVLGEFSEQFNKINDSNKISYENLQRRIKDLQDGVNNYEKEQASYLCKTRDREVKNAKKEYDDFLNMLKRIDEAKRAELKENSRLHAIANSEIARLEILLANSRVRVDKIREMVLNSDKGEVFKKTYSTYKYAYSGYMGESEIYAGVYDLKNLERIECIAKELEFKGPLDYFLVKNKCKKLCSFFAWFYVEHDNEVEKVNLKRKTEENRFNNNIESINQKYKKQIDDFEKTNNPRVIYDKKMTDICKSFNADWQKFEKELSVKKNEMSLNVKHLIEEYDRLVKERGERIIQLFKDVFRNLFQDNLRHYIDYHENNRLKIQNYTCNTIFPPTYEIGVLFLPIDSYLSYIEMPKTQLSDYMSTNSLSDISYIKKEVVDFLNKEYSYIFDQKFILPYYLNSIYNQNIAFFYNEKNDAEVIKDIQLITTEILLASPPGSVNFALIDPLKLSNTFAFLNKFVEYNDATSKLLTGGIATTENAISEKLIKIYKHIENIIAKCSNYNGATIQEYNELAGAYAEPYVYLIIMDFPASFSDKDMKLLEKIIRSGNNCGVFTILMVSDNQLNNADKKVRESFWNFQHKMKKITRESSGYKLENYPEACLSIREMYSDYQIDKITNYFKNEVIRRGRITINFREVMIPREEWFSGNSCESIEIPIGLIGIGKTQNYIIGGNGISHHTLVVGNTGSGKTTLLHTIITNIMLKYSYDELQIFLLDFKHGVEFKCYGDYNLPNIKLVAIESDRKFGYDVLQSLSNELKRRADLFKQLSVESLTAYRNTTGEKMPRILLVIDEYQILFDSKSVDYLTLECSDMLIHLLEQGRSFGIHILLATQNIDAARNLDTSVYNQIAVRIALMCSPNVAKVALGDSSDDVKLLTESGMAIYNYNSGAKEASTVCRIAMMTNEEKESVLSDISAYYADKNIYADTLVIDSKNEKQKYENQSNLYFDRIKFTVPDKEISMRKKVVVPFAVDEDNKIVYCDFENNNFASYIMGAAGSGKSVLLDAIIAGLMMNYHPDELELWMIDCMQTGFSKYAKNLAPHIKTVVLGVADDIVFEVLEQLYDEFERRKKVFADNEWNDIMDIPTNIYMPIIFFIVDEFAEVSQIISQTKGNGLDKDYVTKLENLLREGRKLGFKFIFASQSYNNGMNGLSSGARDQIQMRMALKNSYAEINDTLELKSIFRTEEIENYIATLPPYKTLIKTYVTDSRNNSTIVIKRIENLNIHQDEVTKIIDELNRQNLNCHNKDVLVFKGNSIVDYDSQLSLFEEYESNQINDEDDYDCEDIIIYPGTPQGFKKVNAFFLHKDTGENIIIAGGTISSVSNTIMALIKTCLRQDVKVTIWTDSRNTLFRKKGKMLCGNISVCKGIDEICSDIIRINDDSYNKNEIIFVLGYRNLYDDFDLWEPSDIKETPDFTSNVAKEFDDLFKSWDTVISNPDSRESINESLNNGNKIPKEDKERNSTALTFDARDSINKLLKLAPRKGKHFVFYYDNYNDFKSVKPDMRLFKHKLMFMMDKDFQSEFGERAMKQLNGQEFMYVGRTKRFKSNVFMNSELQENSN